ncbi:choice-of-anchor I family protein [Paenibacillus sp. MBLB4367]|uniref:choice-of-anchor I family protein n=1 Tax=Paenibacillus sp. MBLB4367 TaxID=3384767 RepID=UPI0039084522
MKSWNKAAAVLVVSTAAMLAPQTVRAADAQPAYPGTQELSVKKTGHYATGAPKEGTGAEIVSYDAASKKAFLVNGYDKAIEILDLTAGTIKPVKKTVISSVYAGFDDVTSVTAHPTQDFIAAAVPAAKPNRGFVAFFTKNGDYIGRVPAGYHPDMITVTPDGKQLLVANEGEPNPSYSDDPPGSVTIIDVAEGVQSVLADPSKVTDIDFSALKAEDIDSSVRIFPKGKAMEQGWKIDFEPEYIAVSPDSLTAYITLQENNAIAKLDLVSKTFTRVSGLGYKDHSQTGSGFDASDKDGKINIQPWPVLGAYMPDGMSLYQSGGKTYLVTANEGDARADWNDGGKGYSEEVRVKDIASKIKLDAAKLKGFTQEQLDLMKTDGTFTDDKKLGRLKVSNAVYNVTGAVYYDALYSFGGRSFSIWDADNIKAGPVFDSGDAFEQITAQLLPAYFNSDHESVKFDNRSSGKGPEPEDVKIGRIGSETYAFVGLERMSGIVVYNVTNPAAPRLVTYINHRDFQESDYTKNELGPEGLQFISADKSPTGKPMLLAANEVSGTLAAYEITVAGSYAATPEEDAATYTIGAKENGIPTMTVKPGVTGLRTFTARIASSEAHYGKETAVFKQLRGGVQIGLTAVRADFDQAAIEAQASFNVAAGDVVEVYVVDELTNDPAKLPNLLQK